MNEAYNFPEQYVVRVLISLPTNETFATFVVNCQGINFATNERIIHHFRILLGSLPRFSLRLDVLRKRTAISLRFKNEAFNISERYYSQSLFLFLNSMLSRY